LIEKQSSKKNNQIKMDKADKNRLHSTIEIIHRR